MKDVADGSVEKTSARTWWLCGFMFLATVLNYLDRQVLALTAERIIDEFNLSKAGLGELIAAFRYAYAFFPAGRWLDGRLLGSETDLPGSSGTVVAGRTAHRPGAFAKNALRLSLHAGSRRGLQLAGGAQGDTATGTSS